MIENRLVQSNRRHLEYPRFSEAEYNRRYDTVRKLMYERDLDTLILYGNGAMFGTGSASVAHLSNYRGEFMNYLVFFANETIPPTLFCGISNHLQYIAEISVVKDIRLSIPDPPMQLVNRIVEADMSAGNTGIVSLNPRYLQSIPHDHFVKLQQNLEGQIVDITSQYVRDVLSIKSEEEIEWIRKGARFCDLGMEALVEATVPGATEYELSCALRAAMLEKGAEPDVAFVNSSPMIGSEPGEAITWKQPSAREIRAGDIVTTEFTGTYHGYSGQIHRPIAVGTKPTEQYQNMWEIAMETYQRILSVLKPGNTARDVAIAVEPLEESNYKIYDVLLHGFGNMYMHPFIGTKSSNYWPGGKDDLTETWEFKENMIVVVQPNLCDINETVCFQVGNIVLITKNGPEVLTQYPTEFIQK